MYAVIETGGKQYRVAPGDVIDVELLASHKEGQTDEVRFDRVLLVSGDSGLQVGSPVVAGALVKGTFVDALRGPKIRVFKFKKRKMYRRTKGHRQNLHRIRIDGIELPS
ncbi:MAG TPA: 50S ribosomal protein L21 [Acidobacteria bacterium]|nr:50S ribosomal protein L21 [Acidobacteriota bacterium]